MWKKRQESASITQLFPVWGLRHQSDFKQFMLELASVDVFLGENGKLDGTFQTQTFFQNQLPLCIIAAVNE